MNTGRKTEEAIYRTTRCPYCNQLTPITPKADYEPVYTFCSRCFKKFIIERDLDGISAYTLESAPCCSDPEWRALELGQGDEE